jgi:hypothetical protein
MDELMEIPVKDFPLDSAVVENGKKERAGEEVREVHVLGEDWFIVDDLPDPGGRQVLFYDLKNIEFVNNNGLANLIRLVKPLMEKGIDVHFLNVSPNIKNKISSLGLDAVLDCIEIAGDEGILLQ